jgi:non-heme chloroperoxidase
MAPVERFTERSGVRIRYLDNSPSEPRGLPILFAPGVTDFADEYIEVLEFFLPRRVIVIEVRGRGQSEAPSAGYSVADHLTDLHAVLDEENIDRFHLMTFSRGTSWGLDLALTSPERIETMSIGDYRAAEHGMGPDFAEMMMASRFRGKLMTERIQPHVLVELGRASRHRTLWSELGATGIPLLVAYGTEPGVLIEPGNVQQYRDHVPGVEIVVIRGSGHDLFRPDRLAYPRAVADFITRRAPGT